MYSAYTLHLLRGRNERALWAPAWCVAVLLLLALSLAQSFTNSLPLIVYAIGIRNYALYIPLMFIMGESLSNDGVKKVIRATLWISIPIGLLVFVQFFSPVSSPINKGLDDIIQGRFLVAAGVVRPYGPFTFTQAQTYFSLMCVAALFAAFERRAREPISLTLLLASSAATAVMGALSGSRTFFVSTAALGVFYALPGLISQKPGKGAMRLAAVSLAGIIFLAMLITVFPKAYSTILERQSNASRVEGSIFDRSATLFTTVGPAIDLAPPLGYGIGAGSNLATGARGITGAWTLGEYDWPRMINELGPVIGLLVIGIRVAITGWVVLRCLSASMVSGDAAAMPMCGLATILLVSGQIVGQNQALSFCWFTAGLALALSAGAKGNISPAKREPVRQERRDSSSMLNAPSQNAVQ